MACFGGWGMITKKVISLRKKFDNIKPSGDLIYPHGQPLPGQTELSNQIYEELFQKCKPTREEFRQITNGLIGTPDLFYILAKAALFW
jgi:hypothetical protein